jgi:hypothetical protein
MGSPATGAGSSVMVASACRVLLRPSNHTHLSITPYEGAQTKRVNPLEAVADQWGPTLSRGRALREFVVFYFNYPAPCILS